MLPFTKKYEPKTIKDIVGQDNAIKQLKYFISNFQKQKKKAVLIYGPSGIGKTSSIYAVANGLNLEIVEVNASDFRNKKQINERVGSALQQQSLFSKGKIILVDEIDGLSGTKDRGGIRAITRLIKEASFPLILTAFNPWDLKLSSLRTKSTLIEFESIEYTLITSALKKICKNEKIRYDEEILDSLARRSAGDLRGAINDLQILTEQNKKLTKESVEELSDREKQESIINALIRIFKTTDPTIAIDAFSNVKEDTDQQFLWLDENLPTEYKKPQDLERAYNSLSKADVFRRRIRRWQHWRFLVYINALLTAGIATSKDEKYREFNKYKPTSRLLKIYWANIKNMKKKAIANKIALQTHTSTKQIIKNIDYFRIIFRKNQEMAKNITEEIELGPEEVEWLKK